MLPEEIMLFGLLGALTSLTIGFFVTEGKNMPFSLAMLLVFQGGFMGWIAGSIWVYLTGGLEITTYSLMMPIFISGFFAMIILNRAKISPQPVKPQTSNLALIMLFALALIVAWSSVPIAYSTSLNTQTFSVGPLDWDSSETVIEKTFEPTMQSNLQIPMDIDLIGSSTSLDTLSEKPILNFYYNFKITFRPEADWEQPYIKIGIYKDINNNGLVDDGDVLWSDTQYKIGTGISQWRINCLWEDDKPKFSIQSSNGKLLPIFHAKTLTPGIDETNTFFLNTPEGFKIQRNMITWNEQGLMDYPLEYASIKAGESSSITGRIYCNENSLGNNLILVKTYDARTGDPFADNIPALQEKTFPLTVTDVKTQSVIVGIPNLWIIAGLGVLTFVIIIYGKKEGWLW